MNELSSLNVHAVKRLGVLTLVVLSVFLLSACAAKEMSYQGVLTDAGGSPVADGSYQVQFKLYTDSSGGTPVYTSTVKTVTTLNGVFDTFLDGLPMDQFAKQLYLEVKVGSTTLTPRQKLRAAPYALGLVGGAQGAGTINNTDTPSSTLGLANSGNGPVLVLVQAGGLNSASNKILEGWSGTLSPQDREFYVLANGNFVSDGTYSSAGADYADLMPVSLNSKLGPGDVLVISQRAGYVEKSASANATSVVGVYATKPAFVGGFIEDPVGAENDPSERAVLESLPATLTDHTLTRVPVALVGLVPVKVSAENGSISPGDLLTTSNTPGHAMKATPLTINGTSFYAPGTILGKAMGSLEKGTGVILILLTLH